MTRQQDLKRRVRDRMAATGESYTTARRHVVARAARDSAPPLPAGLVPRYHEFGGGQHHPSTLLAHLLTQAGHADLDETLLAGLGGGIGFMYAVFEYKDIPPLLTIVAQHHPAPWLPTALGHLGIGYTEAHSSSTPAALTALDKLLADGQAVYCEVDRTRLPWHGCEPALYADAYGVVVAGPSYHLDDFAVTPLPLSREDFGAAWAAYKKGRHLRLTVHSGPSTVDLPVAVRSAVAMTVAHLTGPVLGNSFDVNFGFSGMRRLAEQLRDERGKLGWANRFGAPVPFFHGVRRLYECLEEQYTAPGGTRPLYADFLDRAAGILGEPRYAEAAALFRESGTLWSRLASRAASVASGLGAYAELAEERMELILRFGRSAVDEIRALNARIDALVPAGSDGTGEVQRRALFHELADLVDDARTAEERAVALLS